MTPDRKKKLRVSSHSVPLIFLILLRFLSELSNELYIYIYIFSKLLFLKFHSILTDIHIFALVVAAQKSRRGVEEGTREKGGREEAHHRGALRKAEERRRRKRRYIKGFLSLPPPLKKNFSSITRR